MGVFRQVVQFPVSVSPNYTIGFGDPVLPSSQACLLYHGFPAAVVPEPSQEKNQDIAIMIAAETGMDSYVQHYKGLGKSPGQFSFLRSITDSIDFARRIKEDRGYEKLNLVGHSWGGVVALNVLKALGAEIVGSVILLSPFNDFPPRDILQNVLKAVCDGVTVDFEGGMKGVLDELDEVVASYYPRKIVQQMTTKETHMTVIQATDDEEVPVQSTRDFVGLFRVRPVYVEFPSDHKFTIRRLELFPHIVAGLGAPQ